MGILDDITATLNRGTDAAGRAAKTLKLKGQMAEAMKRRQSFAAQLGAAVYEATKDDPAFREGREALYDGIAACDAERAACQEQIDELEAQAAAAAEAARTIECPNCHARIAPSDLYCSGCGMPAEELKARACEEGVVEEPGAATTCPQCGTAVKAGDAFCTSCGARVDDVACAEIVQVETVDPAIDERAEADR